MKKLLPLLLLFVGCECDRNELPDANWISRAIPGATNMVALQRDTYEFDYKGKRILWRCTEGGGMVVLGETSSIQAHEEMDRYYKLKAELEELEDKRGNAPKTDQLP